MPPSLSPDDKSLLRRRLLLFFRKHDASRLAGISDLIDSTTATTVSAAMAPFVQQYGPEPPFYTTTPQERSDLEKRLKEFYGQYEPAKLASVETLVNRYIDMPDELFDALGKKYRPTEAAAEAAKKRADAVDAFKQRLREEFTARCPEKLHQVERLAAEYVDHPMVLIEEIRAAHPLNASSPRTSGTDEAAAAASPPLVPGASAEDSMAAALSWRDRVIRMYSRYQPDKIPSVDSLMVKYAGMEAQMMSALIAKYGPEPDAERGWSASSEAALRARLERYFQHYNPEKIASIPQIIQAFEGETGALFEALTAKYGPESAALGVTTVEQRESHKAPYRAEATEKDEAAETTNDIATAAPAEVLPQGADEREAGVDAPSPTDATVATSHEHPDSVQPEHQHQSDETPEAGTLTNGSPTPSHSPHTVPVSTENETGGDAPTSTEAAWRDDASSVAVDQSPAATPTAVPPETHVGPPQQQQAQEEAETAALQRRIQRIFERHDPAKLPTLPAIFTKYQGMEADLLRAVVNKYGAEDSDVAADGAPHQEEAAPSPFHRREEPLEYLPPEDDEEALVTLPDVPHAEVDASPLLDEDEDPIAVEEQEEAKRNAHSSTMRLLDDVVVSFFPGEAQRILRLALWNRVVANTASLSAISDGELARQALADDITKELQRHKKIVLTLHPTLTHDVANFNESGGGPCPPHVAYACRLWKFLKFDISSIDDGVTVETLTDGLMDLWSWCHDDDIVMDLLVALSGRSESHDISSQFLSPVDRKAALMSVTKALGAHRRATNDISPSAVAFFMRVRDLECVAEELVSLLQYSARVQRRTNPAAEHYRDPVAELKASDAWRDRVVRMLRQYAPGRVGTADALVRAFKGDEGALIKKLQQLYGPEPSAPFTEAQRDGLRDQLLWLYRRTSSDDQASSVVGRVNAVMAAYYGAEEKLYDIIDHLPEPTPTPSRASAPTPVTEDVPLQTHSEDESPNAHERTAGRDVEQLVGPHLLLLVNDEDRIRAVLEMEEYNQATVLRSRIRCLADEAAVMDWVRRTEASRRRVMAAESLGYLS